MEWRPGAGRRALAARASLLSQLRAFFNARDVLEVDTPLLCGTAVTDPNLAPLHCEGRWLQTSPEYAMKRLLADGSGAIFQVCKAFRSGEVGSLHNPEFSLLEWYRPGFTLEQLIEEVAELVGAVLQRPDWSVVTYAALFREMLDLDPHRATPDELETLARQHLDYGGGAEDRDTWLDLLFSHLVEPGLRDRGLLFVTDYPASQAALARVRRVGDVSLAERFELYVDGVELANGYRELTDAAEQLGRFREDNARLQAAGSAARSIDERLIAALESGLPDCAGVALGIDRLLMLREGKQRLSEVLAFDWSRC